MQSKNLIIVLLFLSSFLQAQDAHFSQSATNNALRNPASVGLFQNASQFKVAGSYRSQWAAIPDPFRTFGVSIEQKGKAFSWGIDAHQFDAGEASLQQASAQLKVSYKKQLNRKGSSLRAGVSLGAIQQRFDPEAFQFDNQYQQGMGFNGDLSNQENFSKTSQVLPDLSAGLIYTNLIGKLSNEIGFSLAHLNKPKASFYDDESVIYPMHAYFHIKSSFPINDRWIINGQVQYSKQALAKQLIVGGGAAYRMNKEKTWYFNLATRKGDAIILTTGLQLKNIAVGISYDHHRSKLAGATNGNGAIELSAAYYFNRNRIKNKKPTAPKVIEEVAIEDKTDLDSDKDGIPDKIDECPFIPGVLRFGGCNDKDEDGIPDSKDACPNLYGAHQNKGCPMDQIIDSDMDGLIDQVDECPFLKGLPEHQGCPDTDKDGVSDKVDLCPFLKGTASNNGCPKRGGSKINDLDHDYLPNVHVEFDTDKSIIKPMYWARLDEMVSFLQEQEDLNVYISGHTDEEGNAAYNYELGQRRSFEVQNYFIERGVRAGRISIISYGETKPIHTNKSVYGKAKNRRAEVVLVR